jgi:type II secretory pathway pseudopilin PulG
LNADARERRFAATTRVVGSDQASCLRRAFSMLETSIAVTILGVGLIMVAAVFPVALTQHQNSTEQAGALELLTKAQAMLRARIDTSQLYVPPGGSTPVDSPWYLLPPVNILPGAVAWDAMHHPNTLNVNDPLYGNLISGFGPVSGNPVTIFGLDVLSDRLGPAANFSFSPLTDAELMTAPNRYTWYGFYRQMADGNVKFAAAVCKQRREQLFYEQNVTSPPPATFNTPVALTVQPNRRLPVPWRVTVGHWGNAQTRQLTNQPVAGILGGGSQLATLAPPGAKIMIQGESYNSVDPNLHYPVPAGRILTVAGVVDAYTVQVLEDISDVPLLDDGSGVFTAFDVWLFPPAVVGGAMGKESPVMAWRTNL